VVNDNIFIEPVIRDSRVGEQLRRVAIRDWHTGEMVFAFISEKGWAAIKSYNEGPPSPSGNRGG